MKKKKNYFATDQLLNYEPHSWLEAFEYLSIICISDLNVFVFIAKG